MRDLVGLPDQTVQVQGIECIETLLVLRANGVEAREDAGVNFALDGDITPYCLNEMSVF